MNMMFTNIVYADSTLSGALQENLNKLQNPESGAEQLVQSIVDIAVPLSVISVVALLIYAGVLLISSQGNPDKLKEAKEIITNAIIGFVFILLSVAILTLIMSVVPGAN